MLKDIDLPKLPDGYAWVVRPWIMWDYELMPYPRFGKLAVTLVRTYGYGINPTELRKARALRSDRSIRSAAFRVYRRFKRADLKAARDKASGRTEIEHVKAEAWARREADKKDIREANLYRYIGTYEKR